MAFRFRTICVRLAALWTFAVGCSPGSSKHTDTATPSDDGGVDAFPEADVSGDAWANGDAQADTNEASDATEAGNPCGPACRPITGAASGMGTCVEDQCQIVCYPPTGLLVLTALGPACVDPQTDEMFCGGTPDGGQTPCTGGSTCYDGACVSFDSCALGLEDCGGTCVNRESDPKLCGGCFGGGEDCSQQGLACEDGLCADACLGMECTDAKGTACVGWAQPDPSHCGGCFDQCSIGEFCAENTCLPFVYASGCWQCSLTADYPLCCNWGADTVCVPESPAGCPVEPWWL